MLKKTTIEVFLKTNVGSKVQTVLHVHICDTGSRSTLEFPSRVNFSVPSLYCIAQTLGNKSRHSVGLADASRLTRSDFRLNLLLIKSQRCMAIYMVFKIIT